MDFLSKLFKTPNKNGNICERGPGSALEAIKADSPRDDAVTTVQTQLPEQLFSEITHQTLTSEIEDDQSKSQGLSETNSASLNTLSSISDSALITAADQSRPKSADTDSLDYESADEAVSLKTGPETPAEEDLLNNALGLDALANKLSNLYLNSPNVAKKPPAFHTEDTLNANTTQPILNDSESDISFNASFIEVLNGSVNITLDQNFNSQGLECLELVQPVQKQVAELAPVTHKAAEAVAHEEQPALSKPGVEPGENKASETKLTDTLLVVTPPSPDKLAEGDLINSPEPAELNKQLSIVESLAALSEKAAHSESFAEEDESTITEVSLASVTQNESTHETALLVDTKPEIPKEFEDNSSKEDVSDKADSVLVEVESSNQADVFEVHCTPVSSETEQKTADDQRKQPLQPENLVSEEPIAEELKPQEPVSEDSKSEEPGAEELKVVDPKVEEPKPEEPKAEDPKKEEHKAEEPEPEESKAELFIAEDSKAEEPVAEEPKAEESKPEEPKLEKPTEELIATSEASKSQFEEPKPEELKSEEPHQVNLVTEALEQEKPKQVDQLREPTKDRELEKEEPAASEKLVTTAVESVEEQRLPIKCTVSSSEFPEELVSTAAPVIEIIVPEPIAEVSFEEPKPIEENPIEPSGFVIEFATKPKKAIPARFRTDKSAKEHIQREDKLSPVLRDVDSEPEKEVSVEKPFEERKVSSAPIFVQLTRGVLTPQKDPLVSSTSSLSELLDLCEKQQRNLDVDDDLDKKVSEEANEFEQLLASGANLICDELNASFDEIHGTMSENEPPVTPPRRSRSPRKASPARNTTLESDDPFKTKSLFANSPVQGAVVKKMDGTSSPMTSSSESAIASSRMNMSKSTESASPKSLLSMDSGICGAEVNHSEAGPETASNENFVPASEDLFKDPSAFDFLSKFGGGDSNASRLERESLYVKFDPLVGARDRRVFLSPCVEASPRSEDNAEATPMAVSKQAPKSETPLTSRHAVGPLVQIATPVINDLPTPQPVNNAKSQEGEGQVMQEMVVLLKRESEELKKLLQSQSNDYETKLAALQSKMKQKTEGEEQMSMVMKEYEDTISRILAEKEKALEKAGEDKQKLTEELVIIQSDLSAAEVAFSDLHRKYERAKAAIEVFKSNENTLKQSNLQFQEQIKQAEKKYLVLKSHAEDKLEEAARENEVLVKNSELEMSALKAQSAQLKARNTTLVETLAMRERENQELMTICDDLVQKLGTQSH